MDGSGDIHSAVRSQHTWFRNWGQGFWALWWEEAPWGMAAQACESSTGHLSSGSSLDRI